MFDRSRPLRSLFRRKKSSKPRTRSAADPYSTDEMADIIEQITIGFETIKQFMKEISVYVDYQVSEFDEELQGTITELEKHF